MCHLEPSVPSQICLLKKWLSITAQHRVVLVNIYVDMRWKTCFTFEEQSYQQLYVTYMMNKIVHFWVCSHFCLISFSPNLCSVWRNTLESFPRSVIGFGRWLLRDYELNPSLSFSFGRNAPECTLASLGSCRGMKRFGSDGQEKNLCTGNYYRCCSCIQWQNNRQN